MHENAVSGPKNGTGTAKMALNAVSGPKNGTGTAKRVSKEQILRQVNLPQNDSWVQEPALRPFDKLTASWLRDRRFFASLRMTGRLRDRLFQRRDGGVEPLAAGVEPFAGGGDGLLDGGVGGAPTFVVKRDRGVQGASGLGVHEALHEG